MANQAVVDLIVDAAGALPNLERQLGEIVRTAEAGAPEVDINAGLRTQEVIRSLDADLSRVIDRVQVDPDNRIDLQALLDQRRSLRNLNRQVAGAVRAAQAGADPVQVQAALDVGDSLRRMHGQLRAATVVLERTTPPVETEVELDQDELTRAERLLRRTTDTLRTFGRGSVTAGRQVGILGAGFVGAGAALGGLANTLAAVTAAVSQVAPAALVASQGILALQLVSGTLKIAMIGVEEAIKNAFDPDVEPEELEKSIARLAPEARSFVRELRSMRSELSKVQQRVQNRFFKDLDETLRDLSKTAGPILTRALDKTATSLNQMVRGAATAAEGLARDGTLGKATQGAVDGLQNLEKVPARIVTALGQIAAAAAPAFDTLTKKIDEVVAGITTRLAVSFRSGDLTKDIDAAFRALGQLARSLGNILGGLRNIFSGLSQDGRGLFDILENITEAFQRATASKEFQTILGELASTADTLVKNLLPVFEEAIKQLGPVFEELGPPVREFIDAIGPQLIPLLKDIGPVLIDLAKLFKEQLPVAIAIASAAIATLRLAFQALHFVLDRIIAPAVRFVVGLFQNDLFNAVGDTVGTFMAAVSTLISLFRRLRESGSLEFGNLGGNIRTTMNRLKDLIRAGFEEIGRRILGKISEIRNGINRTFGQLPGQMVQIGRNIVQGLINGISSTVGGLINLARSVANQIKDTINSALDIGSPSREMFKTGAWTTEGFALGMESMLPRLDRAVAALTGTVTNSLTPAGALAPAGIPESNVNVFIGAERLDSRIDFRVNQGFRNRDRTLTQGVRRLG